jgi:exosortase K
MNNKSKWSAQLMAVLLCALGMKLFYSTASPDNLRWILAPTTRLVEFASGWRFTFESHAGYMSSDHSFLIAASCAGVNFLITAFLMLALKKLWFDRFENISWRFVPVAALMAYAATIITNTVRICVALRLQELRGEITWLSPNQLHRAEGIIVYFGFLWLLYVMTDPAVSNLRIVFPLSVYYATTLGLPILNGAYRQGIEFWEHSLFVLVLPVMLVVPVVFARFVIRVLAVTWSNNVTLRTRKHCKSKSHQRQLVDTFRSLLQIAAHELFARSAPEELRGSPD